MLLTTDQRTLQRLLISCCFFCILTVYCLLRSEVKGQLGHLQLMPMSSHRLYPSNWSLIDRKHFEFLLNSDVCGHNKIRLLIIVTSHPGHVTIRRAFRRALPVHVLAKDNIRRVFLLARIDPQQEGYNQTNQSVIEEEYLLHKDIVQGDFIESYRHLSYKHIMGLKYAVHYCPQASWILKMDDDIAVDIYQFLTLLEETNWTTSNLIVGALMGLGNELNPLRGTNSKWDVTYEEYAPKMYPSFVSGWAYVTTVTSASLLVKESETSSFFWIDDVFVTGVLARRCGVHHVDIRSKLTVNEEHVVCCLQRRPFTACRYIVAPVVDVVLMEKFYRHVRECWLKECPIDKQRCDVGINSSVEWSHLPQGEGQVIPIFK